jgi:uncharacterized protein (DUF4415 family)
MDFWMDDSDASVTARPASNSLRGIPPGAKCVLRGKSGNKSHVVTLASGKVIGVGANPDEAWLRAARWVEDQRAASGTLATCRTPGRPPGSKLRNEDQRKTRSVRLDESRWRKLQRLGSGWLEHAIDMATEPNSETTQDLQFKKADL